MKRRKVRLKYKKERVLLSDVLPYELPLIFTNRYFYRFLMKNGVHVDGEKITWNKNVSDGALCILALILGEKVSKMKEDGSVPCEAKSLSKHYQTIPFSYRILHKPTKSRELSVIHPRNQILMVDFYDKYKNLMLYYCSLDRFSLRYPNKVACYFYYQDKPHKTLNGRKTDSLELFLNEYENLRTFFSYKRYNNIYKFYEDYRYQRAEKKFSHLLKFDIQGCFDSIYTHSITWATGGGKDVYKASFCGDDKAFGSKWDKQMQLMNYNETNGIVIGPEFSRIFAEMILQHVDTSVANSLKKEKYEFERDYVCCRYVDDYFFFYNDEACCKKAIELFDEKLREFKLSISAEKTCEFSRPFITDITRAKIRIDELIDRELQYHSIESLIKDSIDEEADIDGEESEILEIDDSHLKAAIENKDRLHLDSRKFNQAFKAILVECNVEAKDVINYTLSRVGNKLDHNIKKFDENFKVLSRALGCMECTTKRLDVQEAKHEKETMMALFMEELLDVVFFLYASNKRVNSTLKVINILNLIVIHMDNGYLIKGENVVKYGDNTRDIVFKKIQDELSLVLKTTSVEPKTQLETLYFLILNKQMRSKYRFSEVELAKYLQRFTENESLNALSIVILLYYYGNEKRYSNLRSDLLRTIKKRIKDSSVEYKKKSAEFCILTLDLLACPFLTDFEKWEIACLMDIEKQNGIDEQKFKLMQNYMKMQKYVFTKWTKIDITKELIAKISQEVYA